MASFTQQEADQQALDWSILRDGGICLYRRPSLLALDIDWFRSHEYRVQVFDSGSWDSEMPMHDDLARVLSFPDYYGRNFNALDECLSEDLDVPDVGGVILCFMRFNQFASCSISAHVLLDLLARASRKHMLRGRRLIILAQSDNPRLEVTGLGEIEPQWNRHEWFLRDRGL